MSLCWVTTLFDVICCMSSKCNKKSTTWLQYRNVTLCIQNIACFKVPVLVAMQWSIASSYVFYRGVEGMSNRPCLNLPHRQYHNGVGCWINCMSTLCTYYHVYIVDIVDIVYFLPCFHNHVYIIHIVDNEILYNTNSNMGTWRSIAMSTMSAILTYEKWYHWKWFCSISYLCQH